MTFFLQKPSLSAIKSAVDDILSLVNDVSLLEKSPFFFSPDIYWMSIFYFFFPSSGVDFQRNNSVNQVIKNMSPNAAIIVYGSFYNLIIIIGIPQIVHLIYVLYQTKNV